MKFITGLKGVVKKPLYVFITNIKNKKKEKNELIHFGFSK